MTRLPSPGSISAEQDQPTTVISNSNFSDAGTAGQLTSGSLLARNTLWNLLGQCVPMAAAIVAIPILVKHIGVDRFGILTLAWMVIGYFSLFDFGLGRALTKLVSEKIARQLTPEVSPLAWTSLTLMLSLGLVGTIVMMALSPLMVNAWLKIPVHLKAETMRSFLILALSIPVVTATTGLRGILEAKQCFAILNAIRIPMGLFTFIGPLLVLPFSNHLPGIILILLLGRIVAGLAHLLACLHYVPEMSRRYQFKAEIVRPLLYFGGWMTVSNIISPLMVSLDRFLIGALISVTAVAYYATPFEVVTKVLLVPSAIVGVLFPAFAFSYAADPNKTGVLLRRSVRYVFYVVFPVSLLFVAFAREGLQLWMGADFAAHSYRVLQLLAVGVLINSLANIPAPFIQAAGRPDITAKLHLVELPLYLAGVVFAIRAAGIQGAAVAWVLRIAFDAALLFGVSQRFLPELKPFNKKLLGSLAIVVLICWICGTLPSLSGRMVFVAAGLIVFLLFALKSLQPEERRLLLRLYPLH